MPTGGVTPAAGGGGSMPVQAFYAGNTVSIANNAGANLTWDTLSSGTDLLDRSTLDAPALLADGTYALTAEVTADALTANGWAALFFATGNLGGLTGDSIQSNGPFATVSITFIAVAGDTLLLTVDNVDGVATRNFSIVAATLVKTA